MTFPEADLLRFRRLHVRFLPRKVDLVGLWVAEPSPGIVAVLGDEQSVGCGDAVSCRVVFKYDCLACCPGLRFFLSGRKG